MTMMERVPVAKCRAIVMFGPATETSGMRAGVYYQVTIDPAMVSPHGDYIRFGMTPSDEIQGWQKIAGLTICEILGEYAEDGSYPESDDKTVPLEMMRITG